MNLVTKSLSLLAALAALTLPAVASAHPEFGRGRGEARGWHERGFERHRARRPRVYAPVYRPRVFVAPRPYVRRWEGPRYHRR